MDQQLNQVRLLFTSFLLTPFHWVAAGRGKTAPRATEAVTAVPATTTENTPETQINSIDRDTTRLSGAFDATKSGVTVEPQSSTGVT
jgi:hypothetical protein